MHIKEFGVLSLNGRTMTVRLRFNMDIESKLKYTMQLYGIDLKKEIWTNSKMVNHVVLTGEVTNDQYQALKKLTK
jgi:hypothetical protein